MEVRRLLTCASSGAAFHRRSGAVGGSREGCDAVVAGVQARIHSSAPGPFSAIASLIESDDSTRLSLGLPGDRRPQAAPGLFALKGGGSGGPGSVAGAMPGEVALSWPGGWPLSPWAPSMPVCRSVAASGDAVAAHPAGNRPRSSRAIHQIFALGGDELEQFRDTLSTGVRLEPREQVVDQTGAARCADTAGQEQGLGGCGRGRLGFLLVEVTGRAIAKEHTPRLVPGRGQQALALGDELVGAGGVAEIEKGLPGVDGEVRRRHPCTPGVPGGANAGEVFLGRCEGAQYGAPVTEVASRREGSGEARLEKAAGGGVRGFRPGNPTAPGWRQALQCACPRAHRLPLLRSAGPAAARRAARTPVGSG